MGSCEAFAFLLTLSLFITCCGYVCEEGSFPTTQREYKEKLVSLEQRFGGLQKGNVPCHHLKTLGWKGSLMCTGGDRMTDKAPSHNYGPTYNFVHKFFVSDGS